MSGILFESLGIEESKHAFVHYTGGPFPRQDEELIYDLHFNNYGAYQLTKCIVEGIKANQLDLEKYLLNDLPLFDPTHPESFDDWNLLVSLQISTGY